MALRGTRARGDAPGAVEGAAARSVEAALRRVFAGHLEPGRGARFARAWRKTWRMLRPLGELSHATGVRVLVEGDAAFEAMWSAIDAARRSVALTTYIFEPDRVGRATLAALTRAARRGCRVTLVVDSYGSHRLTDTDLAELVAAGAALLRFNPIVRWSASRSRLVRNHRKILAVDGELAFVGGMNVAEEYAGERHGNALFRDTQLALAGPCARVLEQLVERMASEERPGRPQAPAESPLPPGAKLVLVHESHHRRDRRRIQRALRTTLARALEHVYLTSPYFVPPARLVRALIHARRRGVDVVVLTAGRSDVPLVRLASQHLHGRLLKHGVRIFELEARTLHAKSVTVDGVYATVGSFNLDYWSDRRNLELTVGLLDASATAELELQFARDLAGAREVTLATWERRTWFDRALGWGAYLLLRL